MREENFGPVVNPDGTASDVTLEIMGVRKEQFLADEEDYLFSLKKIAGQRIKDITGLVSYEFGEPPVFQLQSIEFEDGTNLFVEGEHDLPYVSPGYGSNVPKLIVPLKFLRGSIDE